MSSRRFPAALVAAIDKSKILGIRAGTGRHRIIGIWVVVVEGRVFVRAFYVKPNSWYFAFVETPRGVMQVGKKKIAVRAAFPKSERVRRAVDRAYVEKYNTPWAVKIARGFRRKPSRATTTELMPV